MQIPLKVVDWLLHIWKCFRRKGRKKGTVRKEWLSKNTMRGADCKEER